MVSAFKAVDFWANFERVLDLYNMSELIDFEADSCWITIKLKNGVELKMKPEVTAVLYKGNDPNSGLPIYMVYSANVVKITKLSNQEVANQKSALYH